MKYLTQEEVCAKFKRYVRLNYETQKEAAQDYGVVPHYVSMVCGGKQPPNVDMLADIGLERVVRYVRAK